MSIGDGPSGPNQRQHDAMEAGRTVGFFTDPTLCIGCKACEVACKEWNQVPADGTGFTGHSYDHTSHLGASTWRHVKFVEQDLPRGHQLAGPMTGEADDGGAEPAFRWVFLSDVCKHCEVAGCLEACPTGAIIRTDAGTVFVQDDVCNGCGYCVVSCPFGVIDRRDDPLPGAGGAYKCTFCHDRQAVGDTPACAKACPTESILFGPLDDLRAHARRRVEQLRDQGFEDAQLYDPAQTSVRGTHAFSLVLGDPAACGLPPRPQVPTVHLRPAWTSALLTAAAGWAVAFAAFALL